MAEAFHGGLLEPDPIVRDRYHRLYNIANLDLKAPMAAEIDFYVPPGLEAWYDQGATGMCVGFSGSWCTTERNSTPDTPKKYRALKLYQQCRRVMGADPNDLQGGATMDSCGKALRDWGHVLTIGNVDQAPNKAEGIESYYWGKTIDDIILAMSNGIVPHVGMVWCAEFQSPVIKIDPVTGEREAWIGTHSSFGPGLGLHALNIRGWSSRRNAFKFEQTWGADFGVNGVFWMSKPSLAKNASVGYFDILLCIDRKDTPPINLVQLEPLTIHPQSYGGMPSAHISVRNGGTEAIHLAGIGVHEKSNSAYDIGYWPLDLQPGEVWTVDKVGTKSLGAGNYSYQLRYQTDSNWKDLGNVVSFSVAEPPPVPDPDVIHVPEMTATNSNGTVYVFKDLVGNKKVS